MLKRPKVINISLNSPKNILAATLHFDNHRENQPTEDLLKETQIVQHAYKVITLIAQQRNKQKNKKGQKNQKPVIQTNREAKRVERETQIGIPLSLGQSIEIILKKFVMFKVEEKQEHLRHQTSKSKLTGERMVKTRAKYRVNKQNTEGSVGQPQDEQLQLFRTGADIQYQIQRLQAKIHQLESELLFSRQKLRQKNILIDKLTSKQHQLKQKYHNQVHKLIRNKNIYNISLNYEKELEQQEGRPLLNINGKNIRGQNNTKQNTTEHTISKSSSRVELPIQNQAKTKSQIKQKQFMIRTAPVDNFFRTTNPKKTQIVMNNMQNYNATPNMTRILKKPAFPEKLIRKSVEIGKLQEELNMLIREKDRAVDELNQNNHKIQKYIEEIEDSINAKKKELGMDEMLVTEEELKKIKDQDFM